MRTRTVRVAGALGGLALLLLALGLVFARRESLEEAWQALTQPEPSLLAGLPLAVVGNLLATAVVFFVLINRFGRVRIDEMIAIVAASTLLNFVPMRPGL